MALSKYKKELESKIDCALYERYVTNQIKLSSLLREIAPRAESVFRDHNVMELISGKEAKPKLEDYKFIERRISQQYLSQYNATHALA